MEILEMLLASGELLGCFLELLAAFLDASAGASAYRNVQRKNAGDETKWWITLVLAMLGLLATGIVLVKWTVPGP